ncbi:MAG: 3-isopropylmalate dehydrogenase [Methylocella sp.]
MEKFVRVTGAAAPLMRINIDTEVVIPMNRLVAHKRGELGRYCFEAWRYGPDGSENPEFVLNKPRYREARILVAGENFGCGSSREHAVWSLSDFGFRCVIAPSFGDIFYWNCFQNGVLPIRLPENQVKELAAEIETSENAIMTVDLETQSITTPAGRKVAFTGDPERHLALLEGLDEIGMTLKLDSQIRAHQARDRESRPWIYRREETPHVARLLILAGDGIGPEILAEVRRVVEWFIAERHLAVELHEELFGISAWKAHGELMRKETWNAIVAADAILFGAIGSPEYDKIPAEARKVDQLLRMRKELDLFYNLRPVRTLPALSTSSTLRPDVIEGCDMMLVRELCGGIYFGTPRGRDKLADGSERAVNTCVYTTPEIERIARAAFELARTRSGRVCSVDKANVLPETGGLWRDTVQTLRDRHYPDISLSHMYVDNCAMQLVRAPKQFDVLLTENLFGDILSDCAAMVAGSLGMMPSASMGAVRPDGGCHALYEPIHGSAPDIAGKGIANPLGAIMSFALCLRFSLGLAQEADRLEQAVSAAIAHGARTLDIAQPGEKTISTKAMGDAVLTELKQIQ